MKGEVSFEINKIGFTVNKLIVSAFCQAIRLGTSSPKTKVKNERIIVTKTIAMVSP